MRGFVDNVSSKNISGWVFDPQAASRRVQVRVTLDDKVIVEGAADQRRPDVGKMFGTDGNHGFRFAGLDLLAPDVARAMVEARSVPEELWKTIARRPGLRLTCQKLTNSPTRITVLGTSHIAALRYALSPEHKRFEIINISKPRLGIASAFPQKWQEPSENYVRLFKDTLDTNGHFISMLGGNDHNAIGLIEHPQRFDLLEPGQEAADIESKRDLIPYDALHAMLEQRLYPYLQWLAELAPLFAGQKIHLCSPPPVPSGEHIRNFPGVFKNRLKLGITPAPIRAKLYKINSIILEHTCLKLGVKFVPPPPEACDDDGFLKPEYWNQDPTHGNIRYGKLLLKQIKEHVAP